MRKLFMGIDNGGTVCKVGIYDSKGNEISIASRKVEMLYPESGHTEKDMNEFWNANVQAIKEALSQADISADEIAGISQTGHGNGMFLIDENGDAVMNGIISTDMRAKSYVDKWYSDGTFEKINKKTLQSIWAAQPVALVNWFKDNNPSIIEKTRWILMCKDYIRFKLTGEVYAEITDYSGTNMVNVLTGNYDEDLLADFGIPEILPKLPPLKNSTDICGYVSESTAAATGLKAGTPVMGGFFDIHACAIATGLTDDKDLTVIAGTWSINEFISSSPVGAEELFMTSIYGIPGYWLVTEASPTSASNLEWFMNNIIESSDYDAANKLVESVKPDESDLIFFPYLFGSNLKEEMSSSFIGLYGWHTRAHMLRAIYEGVVFGHRLHIDKLLKYRDKPRKIRISGGASKSKEWVQIFADILGLPVEITEGDELGTLGASMGAAVGAGTYQDLAEAAKEMVRVSRVIEPVKENTAVYERKFQLFKKYLEAVK